MKYFLRMGGHQKQPSLVSDMRMPAESDNESMADYADGVGDGQYQIFFTVFCPNIFCLFVPVLLFYHPQAGGYKKIVNLKLNVFELPRFSFVKTFSRRMFFEPF